MSPLGGAGADANADADVDDMDTVGDDECGDDDDNTEGANCPRLEDDSSESGTREYIVTGMLSVLTLAVLAASCMFASAAIAMVEAAVAAAATCDGFESVSMMRGRSLMFQQSLGDVLAQRTG